MQIDTRYRRVNLASFLAKTRWHICSLSFSCNFEESLVSCFSFMDLFRVYAKCPWWFFPPAIDCRTSTSPTLLMQSNTILSSCSSLFTFIISVVWLKEPFTFFKLAMIGCVMGGTALVSVADSAPTPHSRNRAPNPILGDALVLLSALLYATYTTMLRKELPEERSEEEEGEAVPEQKVSTALVFGFVGLFGALLLWPILLGLHVTGVERVRKMGGRQFGLIIAKGEASLKFCAVHFGEAR